MVNRIKELYKHFSGSSGISIDSRQIEMGCLFFALKGENFDGNKYAAQALQHGASIAIVDDPDVAVNPNYFVVDDVLEALQDLAVFHRGKLKIPIIGITGSNGKTTTKELMGRVLGKKYRTFYTRGNLNNHIGVPLSILSIGNDSEMAIIEMGANHPGEIAGLCNITKPDFGIITNIGMAHLEGFGGFKGVIKAKKELYDFIELNHGAIFVNGDDPLLTGLSSGLNAIIYGKDNRAGLQGLVLENNPFLKVELNLKTGKKSIQTNLIGEYNLPNILAAASVGQYFKVDDNLICGALEEFMPDNNRSQYLETNNNILILDAYNANPTSMVLAIKNFAEFTAVKKMLILGDMLELGKDSLDEHRKILELARCLDFEEVVIVGKDFQMADPEKSFLHFGHVDDARTYLSDEKFKDYTILIKGSRGIQLEKLVGVL
jgi:UDP-N-acetylmuramoyl-tripeptide--D-alanyl-D-alanine ligase